jgi:serine/threonine protein kinase
MLEDPWLVHGPQVFEIWLVTHAILRERCIAEGDRQRLTVQPYDRWLAGQAVLAIEPLMPKAHVPILVKVPPKACGIERPVEFLQCVDPAMDPSEHFGRAVPSVFPAAVGPVLLEIEIGHPLIMDPEELIPRGGLRKVPICHPPLDIEVGLQIALPCLSLVNLLFDDAERAIHRQCLFRLEVHYLHTRPLPVIHRDIKPQNLKLIPPDEIVLLDFGLAKGSMAHTTAGSFTSSIVGYTLHYAPLEQIQGTTVSPQSDLYALAATLRRLLTGAEPVDALTRASAVLRNHPDPLLPAHHVNAHVPASVSQVLTHALALNQEDRPASAAAMRAALRNAWLDPDGATTKLGMARQTSPDRVPTLVVTPQASGHGQASAPNARRQKQPAPVRPPLSRKQQQVTAKRPARRWRFLILVAVVCLLAVGFVTGSIQQLAGSFAGAQLGTTSESPSPDPSKEQNLTELATASASSTLTEDNVPGHGLVQHDPANVLDQDSATSWVEGTDGPGIGEQILLSFEQPITATRLGINVGFDRDADIFYANNRLRRAQLIFADGSTQSSEFDDQRGVQHVSLEPVTTTSIAIIIDDVYKGRQFDDTAIAEVEVWGLPAPTLPPLSEGQQTRTTPDAAHDLWTTPEDGEREHERPKLYGGALVTILTVELDAVKVRTEEGIEGWIRAPVEDALTSDLNITGEQTPFTPGATVRIVEQSGIPLRQEPRSDATVLRPQIRPGEQGQVQELLGDWLKISLEDGLEGWARWYYDGERYIESVQP